ncbi:isochorismate synthase [Candidatus Chlorohelix sp.]|uniref:isochorismate synthase n=1 Tax=Candidatus Chlorohelix sp. TaxID=3139201 RepID=UPI00305B4FC3
MAIATEIFTSTTELENIFSRGVRQAAELGKSILVSYTVPIEAANPIELFGRAHQRNQTAFFWSRPDSNFTLVGAGSAFEIITEGESRFETAAREWRELLQDALIINEDDIWGSGPALMGGYSFDPLYKRTSLWKGYPDGLLILPKVQLTFSGERCYLTANVHLNANTDTWDKAEDIIQLYNALVQPAHRDYEPGKLKFEELLPARTWKTIVETTAEDIANGKFKKVVLARAARVTAENKIDVARMLSRLEASYPTAITYAISRGEQCFAGATPERLVRLQGGLVQTMALAGSMARGVTQEEDNRLGDSLMNSGKDRSEHAIVVGMIKEAFEKVCSEVNVPEMPQLLKLKNVQHLLTPVIGRLAADKSILQLVEQLHPTPAVGGLPGREAIAAIREREQLDRGWYAAPVGWLDRRFEGEFAVALRCALVNGKEATLFAGCGIMGDSNPDSEYAESNLKMRVMLSAIENS